jgi:GH24 family phage-related lysozyme (muramidase)
MYDSVRTHFADFNKPFEGNVPWMYLDVKGLVTVGVGNLIDPVSLAMSLPFINKNSKAKASGSEIAAEWKLLKSNTELAKKGHRACEALTNLRLTEEGIASLIESRLVANEKYLVEHFFREFDQWPADAQLAALSMAWALGAGFPKSWPRLTAAIVDGKWSAAALSCRMSEKGNPGVKPRNDANQVLLNNAANVVALGLEPSVLYYPEVLTVGGA